MRYPQLREDNGEAVTLFPDRHDEILQTDVPIPPKPSDEPLLLTEGSLISSPGGKHSTPAALGFTSPLLSEIKCFPFEEKLLTDLLLTIVVKMWKVIKVITNVTLRF